MSIESKVKQMKQLYSNLEIIQDEDGSIVGMFLKLNEQLKLRWRSAKPTIWDVWNQASRVAFEVNNAKVPEALQRTAEQFKNDWDSLEHGPKATFNSEEQAALKAVMGEVAEIKAATFEEVGPQKQVETPKIEPKKAAKKQEPVVIPEVEEVDTIIPATLPAIVGMGIVRPAVTAAEALAAWKEFQALKKAILEPSDLQRVQGKDCIKKSGWRKFATFYNLTDKIVEETKIQVDDKEYIWKIKVICTAANGRQTEGVAMCSSKEKSGPRQMHDTYSTCHTRAKNRAISDMIAAGEVSAEEME